MELQQIPYHWNFIVIENLSLLVLAPLTLKLIYEITYRKDGQ